MREREIRQKERKDKRKGDKRPKKERYTERMILRKSQSNKTAKEKANRTERKSKWKIK